MSGPPTALLITPASIPAGQGLRAWLCGLQRQWLSHLGAHTSAVASSWHSLAWGSPGDRLWNTQIPYERVSWDNNESLKKKSYQSSRTGQLKFLRSIFEKRHIHPHLHAKPSHLFPEPLLMFSFLLQEVPHSLVAVWWTRRLAFWAVGHRYPFVLEWGKTETGIPACRNS